VSVDFPNQNRPSRSRSQCDVRMSSRVLFWSVTSALAGFLFGFDAVVISGAEQNIVGTVGD
jgi:hypothetical protein